MKTKTQYQQALCKKSALAAILLLGLLTLAIFAIGVGSLPLSLTDIISALLQSDSSSTFHHAVWNIRLPRIAGAIIAGAGLGIAGAAMQTVLKNPLASPFTIGVSQGAAFGAAFAIIVLGAGQIHSTGEAVPLGGSPLSSYMVVTSAFAGSLLAVSFILGLSLLRHITPESIILAGVALSAFFSAATMLLQYFASDMQMAATVFWTFGDLGKAGWRENGMMLAALLVSLSGFIAARWSYNTLAWGDEVAASLGVRVQRLRALTMVASSLTVAVITSFLGIIGFIGLIAPHLARSLLGNDHRFLIPASALLGALLLLLSDSIARTIMPPVILPVGIITSFAGAPLFLYLLIRGRRK